MKNEDDNDNLHAKPFNIKRRKKRKRKMSEENRKKIDRK